MYLSHDTLLGYFNSLPGHTEEGYESLILIEEAHWTVIDPNRGMQESAEIIIKDKDTQKYHRYDAWRTRWNKAFVYNFNNMSVEVTPKRVDAIQWVPR